MKIIFIRHGECDKSGADERGFIGLGRDLAPLTAAGVAQAQAAAESPLLQGCQLILSSPYTRALQTAAIIADTAIALPFKCFIFSVSSRSFYL